MNEVQAALQARISQLEEQLQRSYEECKRYQQLVRSSDEHVRSLEEAIVAVSGSTTDPHAAQLLKALIRNEAQPAD